MPPGAAGGEACEETTCANAIKSILIYQNQHHQVDSARVIGQRFYRYRVMIMYCIVVPIQIGYLVSPQRLNTLGFFFSLWRFNSVESNLTRFTRNLNEPGTARKGRDCSSIQSTLGCASDPFDPFVRSSGHRVTVRRGGWRGHLRPAELTLLLRRESRVHRAQIRDYPFSQMMQAKWEGRKRSVSTEKASCHAHVRVSMVDEFENRKPANRDEKRFLISREFAQRTTHTPRRTEHPRARACAHPQPTPYCTLWFSFLQFARTSELCQVVILSFHFANERARRDQYRQ